MECGGNDGSSGVADGDDVDYGEETGAGGARGCGRDGRSAGVVIQMGLWEECPAADVAMGGVRVDRPHGAMYERWDAHARWRRKINR